MSFKLLSLYSRYLSLPKVNRYLSLSKVSKVIFLLCITTICFAQQQSRYELVVPKHAVKFSPFHLLNFYSTVQLAYEQRIQERWSVQADIGYITRLRTFDCECNNKRGFKVKLEPRYYFMAASRGNFGMYAALEGYLNWANYNRNTTREECFDPTCQQRFIRNIRYTVKYRESGVAWKIGMIKYASRFFFDINSGFAIRFIDYKKPDFVRGFNERDTEWFEVPREETRVGFMPVAGMRIGYSFR